MKRGLFTALLVSAVLGFALPAQAARPDVIWARTTNGAPVTLDGNLDEPAWALAESVFISYQGDAGIPGSGWKPEGGFLPTDPTRATLKFLVNGNNLYMALTLPDSSIGGSTNFNRFDGLLMALKDHLATSAPAPVAEHFYVWWNPTVPDPQPAGQEPGFIGRFGTFPPYQTRTPAQVTAWDAKTVVKGLANSDAVRDTSWTVEMKFGLSALGYDVTQANGDVVEFNISIYDCDNFWPVIPIRLSSNRVWWQGPWGNTAAYNEVRIYSKPSVTVASGPVPDVGPEVVIKNGGLFPAPTVDGSLSEAVWQNAPSFDIRYGDDALRQSYPGIQRWRAGQYQPSVNGGQAAVLDPADATVRYFFRDSMLYLGFDVRDQVVQYVDNFDRHDGFIVGMYDRVAREALDHTLQPRRLHFIVGPTGQAKPLEYLSILVDTLNAAQLALQLKPGTTLDTLGTSADAGYTAELAVPLTRLGYAPNLGDRILFWNVNHLDGDSFTPFTDSYGTRTWWMAEYDNTCCPAYSFLDPNSFITADAPTGSRGTGGYVLMGNSPNPFRSATTVRYALAEAGDVSLEVFDLQGRMVHSKLVGRQPAGLQQTTVLGFGGKTGVYMYRVRVKDAQTGAERASLAGKMMVVR